jgi:hypothetical protein
VNANSDDDLLSNEECDVCVLEPHEAAYYEHLRDEREEKEEGDGGEERE